MKKTLLLVATLISCFHTYSQEAKTSNVPEFVVASRFDVVPSIPASGSGYDKFNFTGSAIYTFLDGNIGDHVSYSMCNHWVGVYTKELYEDLGYSDTINWIDWLYFSFHNDKIDFTLGKDMINLGLWEDVPYDIDAHSTLGSSFWWNSSVYQWGAALKYTLSDETTYFSFNFSSSPFGERPFKSKLFHYGAKWGGEYGIWRPMLSGHLMEYDRGYFVKLICFGQQFAIGEATLELDYTTYSYGWRTLFSDQGQIRANALIPIGKEGRVEVLASCGFEFCQKGDIFGYGDEYDFSSKSINPTGIATKKNYYYAGGGVNYYPLKKSKDLRLHATAAYNNYAKSIALALGATFHFNVTKLLSK
ncbi:MAG: hypothetical protein KBS95_07875 [Alistipes sp.]|nr:hypothetical protein [Candidatus Alistipes equi]